MKVKDTATRYKEQLALAKAFDKPKKERLSIKKSEIEYQLTETGYVAYIIERFQGFPNKSLNLFIGEIKPGSRTGCHRHSCEAAIYVLAGRGYSVVNGQKYPWEEGDALLIPPMSWHQHFNADEAKAARYLAVSNFPQLESLGLAIMEQKEESPAYKGG